MSSMSTDKETKGVAGAAEAESLDAKSVAAKKEQTKKEGQKAEKEEAKPAAKKAEKEEAKPAKKSGAKKPAAKKTDKPEVKPEVFIEYQGQQAQQAVIIEKVRAAFVASGHRASSIKSLNIYIKPEEFKVYYVINDGKYTGDVDLF